MHASALGNALRDRCGCLESSLDGAWCPAEDIFSLLGQAHGCLLQIRYWTPGRPSEANWQTGRGLWSIDALATCVERGLLQTISPACCDGLPHENRRPWRGDIRDTGSRRRKMANVALASWR